MSFPLAPRRWLGQICRVEGWRSRSNPTWLRFSFESLEELRLDCAIHPEPARFWRQSPWFWIRPRLCPGWLDCRPFSKVIGGTCLMKRLRRAPCKCIQSPCTRSSPSCAKCRGERRPWGCLFENRLDVFGPLEYAPPHKHLVHRPPQTSFWLLWPPIKSVMTYGQLWRLHDSSNQSTLFWQFKK